jgi:hypothetical protein
MILRGSGATPIERAGDRRIEHHPRYGTGPSPLATIAQPEFVEGAALFNLNPRGIWRPSLSARGHSVTNYRVDRRDWIKGVVLFCTYALFLLTQA